MLFTSGGKVQYIIAKMADLKRISGFQKIHYSSTEVFNVNRFPLKQKTA